MKYNALFLGLLLLLTSVFFSDFFLRGRLPIPADTVVGLYHPFRDLYANEYPNGIPYKNFLITDPVRQQYPWRMLSVDMSKSLVLPLWNPYNMTGIPLLGNMQSAPLYPLNILLFIVPFEIGWALLVYLQLVLAGVFLFYYLLQLKLDKRAAFFGATAFSFCGFSIAWLEWNTVMHVGLWLPLALLCIEKLFSLFDAGSETQMKYGKFLWGGLLVFSLASAFFAGHLQTFFYFFIVVLAYICAKLWKSNQKKKVILFLSICLLIFIIISAIQWIPTLQMILQSAREVDQGNWQKEGWFIPWQHLIQFVVPDFFGNPTTLNYWGVWNYAEFVGYIGIMPLIMAMFALFYRKDKKTLFFGSLFFLSLIFSLPTFFAKLPYILDIPFLSTSQPTRLLILIDFSLVVLAAMGIDSFLKKKKNIIYPVSFVGIILLLSWIMVFVPGANIFNITFENLSVVKRNLVFPSIIFVTGICLLAAVTLVKNKKVSSIALVALIFVNLFDLLRFADKFTPFTSKEFLFPNTRVLTYLQDHAGIDRVMATDARILPPNFSIMYKIQSIDGYDPLYLRRYGELIAASESNEGKLAGALGFNRIVTPRNYKSPVINLMGVRYVLSLSDLYSPKLKKVYQEGETRVYENASALPRAFFVSELVQVPNGEKEKILQTLFDETFDTRRSAVVEGGDPEMRATYASGSAEVVHYSENKVIIKTVTQGEGFLVLSDTYYPTWNARVYKFDGKDEKQVEIYRVNYNFRGTIVPRGEHFVEFYTSLL